MCVGGMWVWAGGGTWWATLGGSSGELMEVMTWAWPPLTAFSRAGAGAGAWRVSIVRSGGQLGEGGQVERQGSGGWGQEQGRSENHLKAGMFQTWLYTRSPCLPAYNTPYTPHTQYTPTIHPTIHPPTAKCPSLVQQFVIKMYISSSLETCRRSHH